MPRRIAETFQSVWFSRIWVRNNGKGSSAFDFLFKLFQSNASIQIPVDKYQNSIPHFYENSKGSIAHSLHGSVRASARKTVKADAQSGGQKNHENGGGRMLPEHLGQCHAPPPRRARMQMPLASGCRPSPSFAKPSRVCSPMVTAVARISATIQGRMPERKSRTAA